MAVESQSSPHRSFSGQTAGTTRARPFSKTRTDDVSAPIWLGHDPVVSLRVWATDMYYALPEPHITECVIGSDPSVDLRLGDPGGLVSRRHARLVTRAGGGWDIEDLGSKNGIRLGSERRQRFQLVPGIEIGIGDVTLVAENQMLVRLRRYLGRVLGWEAAQRLAVDLALRAIRSTATHRTPLSIAGAEDVVAIGRQIHRCTMGLDAPFVVCGPKPRLLDGSLRVTASQSDPAMAVRRAAGGTVCVRTESLPAGFHELMRESRKPRSRAQLTVCANTTVRSASVTPPLIVVPPLAGRSTADIDRVVVEYGLDAVGQLGAAPSSFTEAARAWVMKHEATTFAQVEIATLRLVALREAGNVHQAAARLGLSHVALGDWYRRRGLAK